MNKTSFSNIEIFNGKNLDDLLQEIYNNSLNKNNKINTLIKKISEFMTSTDDASLIAPLLVEYLEVSVKNDEQLIKLAAIVQKYLGTVNKVNDSDDNKLPLDELQEIIKNQQESGRIIKMANG